MKTLFSFILTILLLTSCETHNRISEHKSSDTTVTEKHVKSMVKRIVGGTQTTIYNRIQYIDTIYHVGDTIDFKIVASEPIYIIVKR